MTWPCDQGGVDFGNAQCKAFARARYGETQADGSDVQSEETLLWMGKYARQQSADMGMWFAVHSVEPRICSSICSSICSICCLE